MNFFAELKRRNVFRVAASYAIVAWIVLQVADTTFPALNIPDWVLSLLTVLFLLGFPLAMFLAWAYEMTPEGVKPSAEVPVDTSIRAHTGQKMNALIVGGLAILLVLVMVDSYVLTDNAAMAVEASTPAAAVATPSTEAAATAATEALAPLDQKSVAVLPFTNLSDDEGQEYFADGLTEELINKLSQVDDLLVTGRNSSFYYKGRDDELRDIGQQLGVRHVLQGSVRKSGSQVRITAQLTDLASNANLWSSTYDETLDDIFTIQDEIAGAVTQALSITLRAGQFSDPGMTGNVEAYDAYLQGTKMFNDALNGNGAFLDAIAQVEKSVALDPEFAIGWTTIAFGYLTTNLGNISLPPSERAAFIAKGEQALQQAKALVPEHPYVRLLEARLSAGTAEPVQWESSLKALIDSGGSTEVDALVTYAAHILAMGRTQEAMRYAERIIRLDPRAYIGYWSKAFVLMNLNRLDESEAAIARGIETGEGALNLQGLRFTQALVGGDPSAAVQSISAYPDFFGPTTLELADTYDKEGRDATLALIRRLLDAGNVSPAVNSVMRAWAAALGEPELALEVVRVNSDITGDMWSPLYQDMRKLPDFKNLLREKGLVAYWRATGNWGDYCRPVNDDFECI